MRDEIISYEIQVQKTPGTWRNGSTWRTVHTIDSESPDPGESMEDEARFWLDHYRRTFKMHTYQLVLIRRTSEVIR